MKILQYIRTHLHILLLAASCIASSWALLNPGLGVGHDLNHQARIFEMATGLQDGNFPVIWSQNLSYGYGMPLFQFYAPLPYFVGAQFYMLGFNLAQSVKLIILTANILAILGSYWLGKALYQNKWAATLTAIVITLAPYRAVDLYVRTAISEGWAISFFIFVLLGIVYIIKGQKVGFTTLPIALACLILSHNLSALLAVPFLAFFAIYYLFVEIRRFTKQIIIFFQLTATSLIGLGLSAFYFIPVFFEKNFTKVDEFTLSSYYDYHQHFLYIRQFIKPWGEWEFGGSGWGPNDEMSFFLGFGQLVIFALAGAQLLLLLKNLKNSPAQKIFATQILFLLLSVGSLFLTLLKIQSIWDLFSFTAYVQFPWRLLAITIVFAGLLVGGLYQSYKQYRAIFAATIIILFFAFNPRYFQSEKYEDHTKEYSNYADKIRRDTSNNLYDYIPTDINFFEKRGFYVYKNPVFTHLSAPTTSLLSDSLQTSLKPEFIITTSTKKVFVINPTEPLNLTVNIAYYPGWSAKISGTKIVVTPDQNGLISISVPAGQQKIELELLDTPIRYWSKITSVVSFLLFLCYIYLIYTNRLFKSNNTATKVLIDD